MELTENMLAPVRERFGATDGSLEVRSLTDEYNEAVHGILPLFDERRPISYWKAYAKEHGFRPTGEPIFSSTSGLWKSDESKEVYLFLAFIDRVPKLHPGRHWFALGHVCDGVAISHLLMIACGLRILPEAKPILDKIAEHWWMSYLYSDPERVASARREKVVADIECYHSQLAELGVNWTGKPGLLKEAVYPIDATPENLARIAVDPPNLSSLVPIDVQGPGNPRWPIIIAASQNSD